jgi:hypothetical protein
VSLLNLSFQDKSLTPQLFFAFVQAVRSSRLALAQQTTVKQSANSVALMSSAHAGRDFAQFASFRAKTWFQKSGRGAMFCKLCSIAALAQTFFSLLLRITWYFIIICKKISAQVRRYAGSWEKPSVAPS